MSEKQILIKSSKEEVAFSLATRILHENPNLFKPDDFRREFLDLYSECLIATNGNRVIKRP